MPTKKGEPLKDEYQEACRKAGLKTAGTKAQLAARLKDHGIVIKPGAQVSTTAHHLSVASLQTSTTNTNTLPSSGSGADSTISQRIVNMIDGHPGTVALILGSVVIIIAFCFFGGSSICSPPPSAARTIDTSSSTTSTSMTSMPHVVVAEGKTEGSLTTQWVTVRDRPFL